MGYQVLSHAELSQERTKGPPASVRAGLRHREKELESVLEELRSFSLGDSVDLRNLTQRIRWLLDVWDIVMGKTGLAIAIGDLFLQTLPVDPVQNARKTARAFYLCISPLEYFIIGLEELIDDAFRDTVTRCGMSCERIVNELLGEVGEHELLHPNVKFVDKVGRLQTRLEKKEFKSAEHLCSIMRAVYDIRNHRGPHDVPSADQLEAKFCVSSFPLLYARYLEVIRLLGYDLKNTMNKFIEICNSIVSVGAALAIKRGHKTMSAGETIEVLLYKNGFFQVDRLLADVLTELEKTGHNLPKPTVSLALDALTRKFLVKLGRRGSFRYRQRVPPAEYYKPLATTL